MSNRFIQRAVERLPFIGLLLLAAAAGARANVCTPLNSPAVGPFAAVVNGVDAVDWGSARIQWTSDATSAVPATRQQIQYGTSSGVYSNVQGLAWATVAAGNVVQGYTLTNLQPNTTYYALGQSYQGGSWCSSTEVSFTTLSKPAAAVHPTPPQTFSVSEPVVTGTDRTVGVTAGCTGSTPAIALQNCINISTPGDGIGLAPGTVYSGQFYIPNNPNALAIPTSGINVSTSTFTVPSHGLSNGTVVHVGTDYYMPNPLNAGVNYYVVNATTNTFQLSYDGVTPVTLVNNGIGFANIYVVRWPLTQSYIVVHSTSSNLPPSGVRLDPVAYAASLPILQLNNPNNGIFIFGGLASYWWFKNIEFTTLPIATAAQTDPPYYNTPVETTPQQDHIVFDQVWFHPAGPSAGTNDRSRFNLFDGSNVAFINSFADGSDYWQPARLIGSAATTSTSVQIPAGTYNWVGPAGTKQTCTNAAASTLNFSAGSGAFYLYYDTSCVLHAQLQTGVTAAGSSFAISTASSPAYPVDSAGYSTVLKIGTGTVANGILSSYADDPGGSANNTESGLSVLHIAYGPGPYIIDNNHLEGTSEVGVFFSDDTQNPCNGAGYCPQLYNTGNAAITRNTITPHSTYLQWNPDGSGANPSWNGGYYFWRNGPEVKLCANCLFGGNIIGPIPPGTASGSCLALLNYQASFPWAQGFVSYESSSNIEVVNNTCLTTAEGIIVSGNPVSVSPTQAQKNIWIHNNLFLKDNAWALYGAGPYPLSENGYHQGFLYEHGAAAQNDIWEHNTVYGQGGQIPYMFFLFLQLISGDAYLNNILNLVEDNGSGSGFSDFGNNFAPNAASSTPACPNVGAALLACETNNSTWLGNVILGTYSNSNPSSLVELTNSQIQTAQALYPAAPGSYWPTNGTALADRINQVAWFNPSLGNFRLRSTSPYISGGANHASDGLDIGVNMDALEAAQGKVSNVRAFASASTSTTIAFLAPDSFGCTVDWATSNFTTGSGTYTRVANSGGQRAQNVTLAGLPAHALIYYRVNCAVQQPTGSVQLP